MKVTALNFDLLLHLLDALERCTPESRLALLQATMDIRPEYRIKLFDEDGNDTPESDFIGALRELIFMFDG
jgi:hypothetical protein